MNEQALQDAYNLFSSSGYSGSLEDFMKLISTNENALNDSYSLFKNAGYNGSAEDYSTLVGVKKKTKAKKIYWMWKVVHQMWTILVWTLQRLSKTHQYTP